MNVYKGGVEIEVQSSTDHRNKDRAEKDYQRLLYEKWFQAIEEIIPPDFKVDFASVKARKSVLISTSIDEAAAFPPVTHLTPTQIED